MNGPTACQEHKEACYILTLPLGLCYSEDYLCTKCRTFTRLYGREKVCYECLVLEMGRYTVCCKMCSIKNKSFVTIESLRISKIKSSQSFN